MKKTSLSFLLLVLCLSASLLLASCAQEQAQEGETEVFTEGLEYSLTVDGDGYKVCGIGVATDTDIILPTVYNGLSVVEVGEDAFKDTAVTSVKIGDNVTTVGAFAFAGCTGIEKISFGKSVATIADSAFSGCTALKKVVFGDAVEKICEDAFDNCKKLNTVVLPAGLKTIEDFAFNRCTALKKVYYKGTAETRADIEVSDMFNAQLLGAKWYYFSATEPSFDTEGEECWHYDEDGNEAVWEA